VKKIIAGTLLATMLSTNIAAAADTQDPWADIAGISPLRKNQPAPYSGVLLTPKATATVIANADLEKDRIALEVQHALADADAQKKFALSEADTKCTADKKVLQSTIDEKSSRLKIVEDELSKASDPPSRLTWAGLGFAGGVAATVLIVFGVSRVTNK